MEMHCDKKRGRMDIYDIGIEALIHWNGPPLHLAEKLGMKSLDRHFGGRGRWNFVTRANKTDSSDVKRLKNVETKVSFFKKFYNSAISFIMIMFIVFLK